MSAPFDGFAELRTLLDALCEESITPEQFRRLEELLLTHPEAEAYYVQFMGLYAALGRHFTAPPGLAAQSLRERVGQARPGANRGGPGGKRKGRIFGFRSRRFLVSVAALAAAIVLAVELLPNPPDRLPGRPMPPGPPQEATDNTVAVLLQAHKAVWERDSLPARPGAPLPPGWLRLKSGLAHIEFYSGATVILEGPAEFQLISRKEAFCLRGKLRATVPPQAQGFAIGSPKLELVDRGTEFGLNVGDNDKTEVHVFQGQVDLYCPGSEVQAPPQKALTTGQSVRLDGPGPLNPIELNPTAFHTVQQLTEETRAEMRRQQAKWEKDSEALCRDPALRVYFPFQPGQEGGRTLDDLGGGRKQPCNGAIVGCSWVGGRWPGKQALEFKRVSDRVRFHGPGDLESLTLAAWVRVDGLPNRNNSLMMTDGWATGGVHWQIGDNGTLILGVRGVQDQRAHYHATGIFTPDRFGLWVHLAVVYDGATDVVTHYVDGRAVTEEPTHFDTPLRIGDAEIGNWNLASHRNNTPVRFLNGRMDEFLLFTRPLAAQEIEQLYTQGRPPS